MKILKLYFDTSIFNFALATEVPIEREITLKLFDEVKTGKYEVLYIRGSHTRNK